MLSSGASGYIRRQRRADVLRLTASGEKLDESQTLKLVKLYQFHQLLWDAGHAEHNSRECRLNAYQRIVGEMNVPGFGVPEVVFKIGIIRHRYLRELKKMRKCTYYVSRIPWFPIINSMIGDQVVTINAQKLTNNVAVSTQEEAEALAVLISQISGQEIVMEAEDHITDGPSDIAHFTCISKIKLRPRKPLKCRAIQARLRGRTQNR